MSENTAPAANQSVETLSFSEQEQIRREKLSALIEAGNSPYQITNYQVSHQSGQVIEHFDELEGQIVSVSGRMMSRRIMGKASFAHLRDARGDIQIYVKRDEVGDNAYAAFKNADLGDILGVKGPVFKTRTGEVSVHAQEAVLLSKCLKPLPDKWHGLQDMDLRYRQRYLDMIVNPQVRDTFVKRSRIISSIRSFMDARGYLEVDTPILHTLEIGAAARPFQTHHNTLDIDMYLRVETELYLKRLIVGGFDKVYEIGRIFRNEGMDTKHNPEFTSIEMYQAYGDYNTMMDLAEELFQYVARTACGTETITFQGKEIHLGGKWERLTMAEAVKRYSGIDFFAWESDEEARACLDERHIQHEKNATRGDCLPLLFDEYVEKHLIQPTFITDYPVENSPLAKRKPEQPRLTERFELFINGTEYGNAFSELNDPIDQRERFVRQVEERRALGGKNAKVDEDFVNALEYGMPPTGGMGIGVDRLIMLLTDNASIRDILLFPTMKPVD